ncbi:MAG: hypothetical protein WAM42_20545 [Candidatus Nitrosopolaris sp.]
MSRIKVIEAKIVQTEESWMIVYERVRDPSILYTKVHLRGSRKEIEEFYGDEQLVLIWINYLMECNYLNTVSVVTNEDCILRNFIDSTTREITTLYK